MLTLFTTPVVYVYLDRLRLALRGGEDEALPGNRVARRGASKPGALTTLPMGTRSNFLPREQVATRKLHATSPEKSCTRALVQPAGEIGEQFEHRRDGLCFGCARDGLSRMIGGKDCLRATISPEFAGRAVGTGKPAIFQFSFRNFFQESRMLKKAAALFLVGCEHGHMGELWYDHSVVYLYAAIPAGEPDCGLSRRSQRGRAHRPVGKSDNRGPGGAVDRDSSVKEVLVRGELRRERRLSVSRFRAPER